METQISYYTKFISNHTNAKELYRRLFYRKAQENNSEFIMYFIENNHEAIVSREALYRVQKKKLD